MSVSSPLAEVLQRERHRTDTLREVKIEADNFEPQLRAFPVVVLQPDDSEVACGRKLSLEENPEAPRVSDIETGDAPESLEDAEASREEPSAHSHGSDRERGEQITYNPLTHYLTGQPLTATQHHSMRSGRLCSCTQSPDR